MMKLIFESLFFSPDLSKSAIHMFYPMHENKVYNHIMRKVQEYPQER